MFRGKSINNTNANPHKNNAFIQPKLKVGKIDDPYEQQADKAADQIIDKGNKEVTPFFLGSSDVQAKKKSSAFFQNPVVPTISPGVQLKETVPQEDEQIQAKEAKKNLQKTEENGVEASTDELLQTKKENKESTITEAPNTNAVPKTEPLVQKKEEEEIQEKEEEDTEQSLQKSGDYNTGDTSGLERNLSTTKGGGESLPTDTQSQMESGFGADFSGVRVHNDSNAVQMNQDLGSQAFTNGNDIYFNEGKYDTGSDSGKHLLAHELTHTVQQGASPNSNTIQQKQVPSPNVLGMPTTILDITNGLQLTEDWKTYSDGLKSTEAFDVQVKIGSQYKGILSLKKASKPKEGEQQKYKLANRSQFLESKGLTFLNPLRSKGLYPILAVDLSKDEQKITGYLSFRTGDKGFNKSKNEFLNVLNTKEGKEAMKLFGLGKIKSKMPDNTFENGKLHFKTQDLSVSVDGFIMASGSIGISDENFTFELNSTVNVGGLAEGAFNLTRGEDGNLNGKASIGADIANVNANISIEYEKGVVTIQGVGRINSEKFSGELTLLVTDEAKSKSMMHAALGVESMDKAKENAVPKAPPTVAKPIAKKPGNQVLAGWGTVEATITPWLQGTAKIGVDAKGQITIVGEVSVPNEVKLMEQMGKKEDLFEFEIRAGYGIPLVGQAFLFASIGMFANAGFGPLVLNNVGFTGKYSTDPKILQDFNITGTLGINAFVILGLKAEAGVGITIIGHDVKAGVSVTAAAGLQAYAEASPTFEYKEANNPEGGKVGESRLKGHFEAAAQLFLQLAGSLFYELDSPWWSPAPDGREDFPLGKVQYPIGDSMGIGADIDWLVGSEEPPELKFAPVEFDPDKFTADVMAEPSPRKMGKSDAKPKGKFENKGGSSDKTKKPKATGNGKGLPPNNKKKEDLKKLPDEQKYMRGLDELSTLEKQTPKPVLSVVNAKMKRVKSKYGLKTVRFKSKKDGEVTIYVAHGKQNNGKHLLKIPLMSLAEAMKLRHTAMQDLRIREAKAIDPKTSTIEESKAKAMILAWHKAHPVVETATIVDGKTTWNYFIDFGDKSNVEKGKLKKGNTDENGIPKGGDGEVGESIKFNAEEEKHTLWVKQVGKKYELTIASTPTDVREKLNTWSRKKKNKKIGGKSRKQTTIDKITDEITKARNQLKKIDNYLKKLENGEAISDALDNNIESAQMAMVGSMTYLFKIFDDTADFAILYVKDLSKVHEKVTTPLGESLSKISELENVFKQIQSWSGLEGKLQITSPLKNIVDQPLITPSEYKTYMVEKIKLFGGRIKDSKDDDKKKKDIQDTLDKILEGQNANINKVLKDILFDKTKEDKLETTVEDNLDEKPRDHNNFAPSKLKIKEGTNGVYNVEFETGRSSDTKTEKRSDKAKFNLKISFDNAANAVPDATETREVLGQELIVKPERYSDGVKIGRGKTNPGAKLDGKLGFDNAHIIGDQFGGSGINKGFNIHPSSIFYNRNEMAGVENRLAGKLKSEALERKAAEEQYNINHDFKYQLEVTAGLKDDDESNMKTHLKKYLETEIFNADNKNKQVDLSAKAQKTMVNKLQDILTLDFKQVPAQFMGTYYKTQVKNAGGGLENFNGVENILDETSAEKKLKDKANPNADEQSKIDDLDKRNKNRSFDEPSQQIKIGKDSDFEKTKNKYLNSQSYKDQVTIEDHMNTKYDT